MATDLGSGLERIGWALTRRDWRHLAHESLSEHSGRATNSGPRSGSYIVLDALMLFQMVGYALLDFQDEFTIREVTFFNARYGHPAAGTSGTLGLCRGVRSIYPLSEANAHASWTTTDRLFRFVRMSLGRLISQVVSVAGCNVRAALSEAMMKVLRGRAADDWSATGWALGTRFGAT
ncbi:hypothetical protein ACLMAJ_24645 [Nocardia sp. KC 131]|uniref:hypothetical protein n=1 Tax=Nocardia arseniciresistens TaxID=3392119 RepID=UPI00398ECD41